jgi:hypothetical protein
MEIEHEFNFKKSITEGINLFLGAGFSVLAHDGEDEALPTGPSLTVELRMKFGLPENLDLPQLATILSRTRRVGLRDFLKRRFTVKGFNPLYHAIECVAIRKIFTTNIDDLLFNIYSKSIEYYLNDLDIRGPVLHDRSAVDLVTLHGCILDESRELTFTAPELAASFRSDPDRWYLLTEAIQTTPTLFWGYSVNDAGTLEALHPGTVHGRPTRDMWILLLPTADEGTVEYFRALNFQIIRGTTEDLLHYFRDNAAPQLSEVAAPIRSIARFLREYSIPDPTKVPVRSWSFTRGRRHRGMRSSLVAFTGRGTTLRYVTP